MGSPEHSIGAPGPAAEDRFASRNNFLFFLLGVISSAERVLGVLPQALGADEGAITRPGTGTPAPPADAGGSGGEGLLR